MRRTNLKPPSDVDSRVRREAADIESAVAEGTPKSTNVLSPGDAKRHLIAAKAGRSGTHDTARRIKEIIRQRAR